ncbi:GNAT family N-acetyltransferase [Motiliproteus sp. SC1-56]|uniref:GNAT family N-acetyltransferase n=1 Tax=Motiliproteus sp. SC1-56 TaxID=2799565 RepID=UPI001A8DD7D4|nr:GNAT family N-acetyltransferase [Motiliproteus sp. SC1-56]
MSDTLVKVRALSPEDLGAIVALDQQFSGAPRSDFFSKRLRAQAAHPETFVSLTATIEGRVAGFVSCQLLEGEFGATEPVAVLDAIGVDREYQRRGVGQRLFARLIEEVRTRGGRQLHSVVTWDQPALLQFFADAGFKLADRLVLELPTDGLAEGSGEGVDLSRDRTPMRSLETEDLESVVSIDRHSTGRDRSAYFQRMFTQALEETGIRVSLVADKDDAVKDNLARIRGFVMARVDFGEFGQAGSEAVIDTLGVDPAFRDQEIGRALISQLVTNLKGLRVESVRTEVPWDNFALNTFLCKCGFRPAQRLALSCRLD